jgi:hypothetical protein
MRVAGGFTSSNIAQMRHSRLVVVSNSSKRPLSRSQRGRWIEANPASAPATILATQEKKWPPIEGRTDQRPAGPSTELFMIWGKDDLPGMIKWAEPLDIRKDELARKAKGFLMSRVDAGLATAGLLMQSLKMRRMITLPICSHDWAAWDPKASTRCCGCDKGRPNHPRRRRKGGIWAMGRTF